MCGFVGSLSGAAALDLDAALADHQSVAAAAHAYCAAEHGVAVQRAGRLPGIDVSLSANDKTVDETTRADAFGGENSPEYDGHGLDARLTVSQTIYDWGKTGADIGIAEAQRRKQDIAFAQAVEDSLRQMLGGAVRHEAQRKAVTALRRNVQRLEVNRKAVAEQVRLGYAGRRKLNDYDLLLLERRSLLADAQQSLRETAAQMQRRFGLSKADAKELAGRFKAQRPASPQPVDPTLAADVRLTDEEIRIFKHRAARVRAQGRPEMAARVSARGWDLDESAQCTDIAPLKTNCSTHDVVGSLEFSMPLYSGGARINRGRAALAKQSEMQARRLALLRRHEADNAVLTDRFDVQANRLLAEQEKVELLQSQLKIERGRQKTNAIRFEVIAELDSRLADAKLGAAALQAELELLLADNLVRRNALVETLQLDRLAPDCG